MYLLKKILIFLSLAAYSSTLAAKHTHHNSFFSYKIAEFSFFRRFFSNKNEEIEKALNDGKSYEIKGNYKSAIIIYQKALELFPDDISLQKALTSAYFAIHDFNQSRKLYLKILENEPEDFEALTHLGRIEAMQGNQDAAEKLYRESLKINSLDFITLESLAELLIAQHRYSEAEEIYRGMDLLSPGSAKDKLRHIEDKHLLHETLGYEDKGEWQKAIAIYEKLHLSFPENKEYLKHLGALYNKNGQYEKSIALYSQALETNPNQNDIRLNLAIAYLIQKDYVRSEQIFQQILSNHALHVNALTALGYLSALKGNEEDAEKKLKIALELVPDYEPALVYLRELYQRKNNYERVQEIDALLNHRYPTEEEILSKLEMPILFEPDSLMQLIYTLNEQGMYEESIDTLQFLIQIYPANITYRRMLGQTYGYKEQWPQAIDAYQQALVLDPENPIIRHDLALAYLYSRELTSSKRLFSEILELNPKNADALAGLGNIATLEGHYLKAENYFQQALSIDPDNELARSYQAELFVAQGKHQEASQLYSTLSQKFPDRPYYRDALKRTEEKRIESEALVLQKQQRYNELNTLYDNTVSSREDVDTLLNLGWDLQEKGHQKMAIKAFEKALSLAPNRADVKIALASAYINGQQLTEASALLQDILSKEPQNLDAIVAIGRIAGLKGNQDEAERRYLYVLNINNQHVGALGALAELRMLQKRYPEAHILYKKLIVISPNENYVKIGLAKAKAGMALNQAASWENEDNENQANQLYEDLIASATKADVLLFIAWELQAREHQKLALKAFIRALELERERVEVKLAVASAFITVEDSDIAEILYNEILAKDPSNLDAKVGIGRIAAFREYLCEAEKIYFDVLKINPKHETALGGLAELRMKQKFYQEALELYENLASLYPNVSYYKEGILNAKNAPYIDSAQELIKNEQFASAAEIYLKLLDTSPNNVDYFQTLGQIYRSMQCYDAAISAFERALEIKPKQVSILIALGFVYMDKKELDTSQEYFSAAQTRDPTNIEALSGLGNIETLRGCYCAAEKYLYEALDIKPNDMTALGFLATLRTAQRRFFSARDIYCSMLSMEPDTKWVRTAYRDTLENTRPSVEFIERYYEEDQYDLFTGVFSARYQQYGEHARGTLPISNPLTVAAYASNEYLILRDSFSHFTVYWLEAQRAGVAAKWIYDPRITISAYAGLTWVSNHHDALFKGDTDLWAEPGVLFEYNDDKDSFTLGAVTATTEYGIVSRNFNTFRATLIPRYFLLSRYIHTFCNRDAIGIEDACVWFNDDVHNHKNLAAIWFQVGVPHYWENFVVRYRVDYSRFDKPVINYWTYKYEFILTTELEFTKKWNEYVYTYLGYAHSWSTTLTNQVQQITVFPLGLAPFVTIYRDINAFYGSVDIKANDDFKFTLLGYYSRNSVKFTMWSLSAKLLWRF